MTLINDKWQDKMPTLKKRLSQIIFITMKKIEKIALYYYLPYHRTSGRACRDLSGEGCWTEDNQTPAYEFRPHIYCTTYHIHTVCLQHTTYIHITYQLMTYSTTYAPAHYKLQYHKLPEFSFKQPALRQTWISSPHFQWYRI